MRNTLKGDQGMKVLERKLECLDRMEVKDALPSSEKKEAKVTTNTAA